MGLIVSEVVPELGYVSGIKVLSDGANHLPLAQAWPSHEALLLALAVGDDDWLDALLWRLLHI